MLPQAVTMVNGHPIAVHVHVGVCVCVCVSLCVFAADCLFTEYARSHINHTQYIPMIDRMRAVYMRLPWRAAIQ